MHNINGVRIQTVESFWTLVSKDRFPKLKDFVLKCARRFEAHMCVGERFLP